MCSYLKGKNVLIHTSPLGLFMTLTLKVVVRTELPGANQSRVWGVKHAGHFHSEHCVIDILLLCLYDY